MSIKSIISNRLIYLFILTIAAGNLNAQKQANERAQWFVDSRFGMFIHWGVYSGAEGYWKGEKVRNDNNYAEWIYYRNGIEKEEYVELLDRFSWDEIDPEEWVILAKRAGMKYIVFTAKHHDGFGLWNSGVGKYDIGDYTIPERDIVDELSRACKKHGLRLGLYYSHWVDWEHKYGWDHSKEISGITADEYDAYWQEKVIPQMRELLTNYGDIGLFWFDMWVDYSKTVVTKEQLLQLKSLIRELQPDCLVNSRLGLSIEVDPDIDFKTLGDNELGDRKEDFPWQSPATIADSWAIHSSDSQWKSTTTLLHSLINNVSMNGNYLLNIGPRANGNVPYEISKRLFEIGEWMDVNGESIYGAEAFDLPQNQHDWGRITCRKTEEGLRLYLHVFNWPLNRWLSVTGINTPPEKVYVLADKKKQSLPFEHQGCFTAIQLPVLQPDPFISVLVLEYLHNPGISEGLVAKTVDGGYSLVPENQSTPAQSLSVISTDREGTIPRHVVIKGIKTLNWKIYVDEPGPKRIDVSYSCQNETNHSLISCRAADSELDHNVAFTGKTVGEPNLNWVINKFKSFKLGEISFSKRGIYPIEIQIRTEGNEEVSFQWAWIH